MVSVEAEAQAYFRRLIEEQDMPGLGLRMTVLRPGTPTADCELTFCPGEDVEDDDHVVECAGFNLYVDPISSPHLEDAVIDFEETPTGGQINVSAPKLRATRPDDDAPLADRVAYVLESEVNPSIASHGGRVSLVTVEDDKDVVLQFGGGCHGCSMVGVTLKDGVERTLRQRLPEIGAIRDVTDHASGENPYYS